MLARVLILVCAVGLIPLMPRVAVSSELPDLIITTDGSRSRGTIVESVSGGAVTYINFRGETVELPWSEIEYAGPADEAPGAASPDPTATARPQYVSEHPMRRLTTGSDAMPMRLLRITGSAVARSSTGAVAVAIGYQELCPFPCAILIEEGAHRLVVAYRSRAPVPLRPDQLLQIDRDLHIDVLYEDRRMGRMVGLGVAVVGAGIAIAGGLTPRKTQDCEPLSGGEEICFEDIRINIPLIAVGSAVMLGGGGVWMLLKDRAHGTVSHH